MRERINMKIPKKVRVGPLVYKVRYDPNLRTDKGEMLFGTTLFSEQEIVIFPHLSHEKKCETFLHELLHAISAYYGLWWEEEKVGTMAPVLYDTLNRNGLLSK